MIRPKTTCILAIGSIVALIAPATLSAGPMAEGGATDALILAADMESENRRQALLEAREKIDEARGFAAEGRAEEALGLLAAVRSRLVASPFTEPTRIEARDVFTEVALTRAESLARRGSYDEANGLIGRVLDPAMNPDSTAALGLRERINDGDRFPPALAPGHIERVEDVVATLRLAEDHFRLGNFEAAEKTYFDVLVIDRYNSAARRGLERVERMRVEYANAARNHTRARMLRQVEQSWDLGNPEAAARAEELVFSQPDESATVIDARNRTTELKRMAENLMLDRVVIRGMSVSDATEYLAIQARQADPQRRNVNIVVRAPSVAGDAETRFLDREVTLVMDNVPLAYVLEKLAQDLGMVVRYEGFAIVLSPVAMADDSLYPRTYRVPPDFIASVPDDAGGAGGAAFDPFGANEPADGLALRRLSPREFLQYAGITFPPGSNVAYNSGNSTLSFRNNAANHELLETLIERASLAGERQVTLAVRMIEIGQQDLEELGFDWLLGAFDTGSGVLMSGGTNPANVLVPGDAGIINPLTGLPVGANMVTAGNRSGNSAVRSRTIDSLLDDSGRIGVPDQRTRAPAPLVVAGVLSEPDFMMIMRGLSQKKGTDFMQNPTVVTKSGIAARFEAVREFIYPTEFDPPELPTSVGQATSGVFPVTPAHPSSFDVKNLGTTMEVEPVISPDGRLVQVSVNFAFTEFIGFVNYGSPIFGATSTLFGPAPLLITENRIVQPIFETRRLTTNNTIYDGQLLVIGGLLSQTIEDVEDRVPILGDVPMLGRFFKSSVRKSTRRVLMIFLQAEVLDPSGRPLRELGYGDFTGNE